MGITFDRIPTQSHGCYRPRTNSACRQTRVISSRGDLSMYAPAQRTKHRTTLGLLTVATLLHSNISNAQLTPADHGAAVIDRAGLMWANTVGVNLTWDPAGEAGTAQAW